jgi:hypothetical protein
VRRSSKTPQAAAKNYTRWLLGTVVVDVAVAGVIFGVGNPQQIGDWQGTFKVPSDTVVLDYIAVSIVRAAAMSYVAFMSLACVRVIVTCVAEDRAREMHTACELDVPNPCLN